eukprot:COSAG06_NODE_4190_length_4491_cov_1.526412_1_plen_35_part_10
MIVTLYTQGTARQPQRPARNGVTQPATMVAQVLTS